ncbi:hypothetical protein [Mycobacterium sp. NPDC050853]|uniref:hypothetical protein n=1 Tax=Mycobacterium sp. NPDC050853 TaxID=3155160 RepID=UPI00340CDD19
MITKLTKGQKFTAAVTGIDRYGVRLFRLQTFTASRDQDVEPFHTPTTRTGIPQDRVFVEHQCVSGTEPNVPALVVTGSIRLVDA